MSNIESATKNWMFDELDQETLPRVSIIIPNHNYCEFIGIAIDSALALDWPNVEIIVVDDGSTDGSRDVIARYESRIEAIFQEKSGQQVACNKGFLRSSGEWIIFLDSDDVLDPSLVWEVARIWQPSASKVQFQMQVIDAAGKPTGSVFPKFRKIPTPQLIRKWASTTSAYPTPPGSGNLYARWFISMLLSTYPPVDTFSDTQFLCAAPFVGDVLTIPRPLVSYRVHGRNSVAQAELITTRFRQELVRAMKRFHLACDIARDHGIVLNVNNVNKSLSTLGYRIASYKMSREKHPIERDSMLRIFCDLILASFKPQGNLVLEQALLVTLHLFSLCLPEMFATLLIRWRHVPSSRPALLRRFGG